MRQLFSLTFLCLLTISSRSQLKCDIVSEFKKIKFSLITDTAYIPKYIKDTFSSHHGEKFFFAHPDELFNNTDIVLNSLPNERLIFAGCNSKNKIFFIYYEQGGDIALSNKLFVIKQKGSRNVVIECDFFSGNRNLITLKEETECKECDFLSREYIR